jgi:hypothetical protein
MEHECIFYGDVQVCSYWPDPLHYIALRAYSADWSRALLLSSLFGKSTIIYVMPNTGYETASAAVRAVIKEASLKVSNRGGYDHLAQPHGNRIDKALLICIAFAFPEPYAQVARDKQIMFRFLRRIGAHPLAHAPSRTRALSHTRPLARAPSRTCALSHVRPLARAPLTHRTLGRNQSF